MMKLTVRYPRRMVEAEFSTKAKCVEVNPKCTKYHPKDFEFSNGIYSYLYDVVAYMCNHEKQKLNIGDKLCKASIKRGDFRRKVANGFKLPKSFNTALYGATNAKPKLFFWMVRDKPTVTRSKPVGVELVYSDKPTTGRGVHLKGTTGKEILSVDLSFDKDLWASSLSKKGDRGFIILPSAFTARLHHAAVVNGIDPKLVTDARKVWLYILSHDNGLSDVLNIDPLDMARCIAPRFTRGDKWKNKAKFQAHFESCLELLHLVGGLEPHVDLDRIEPLSTVLRVVRKPHFTPRRQVLRKAA